MEISGVEHLTGWYGQGEARVNAPGDASFYVEQGEFVAITGPSRNGKSTLLHLLGGVDRPADSKVYVSGKDIYALDETTLATFRRRQIGLICQFYNLIPVLNMEESITLPLLLDDHSVSMQQLGSMVEALGLRKRLQYLPGQLNGGQQQRVSIDRALMASPAIALADESIGNLDRANSRETINLLKRLHDEPHQILIIITYDEGIVLQVGRTLKIGDGHIVRDEMIRR